MKTRNCECCDANYATGKDYGEWWCVLSDKKVETKGLCEFCNVKSKWFCCGKHGVPFKIGHVTYQSEKL